MTYIESYDDMEMPAPCSRCGGVQELHDFTSSHAVDGELVCDVCHNLNRGFNVSDHHKRLAHVAEEAHEEWCMENESRDAWHWDSWMKVADAILASEVIQEIREGARTDGARAGYAKAKEWFDASLRGACAVAWDRCVAFMQYADGTPTEIVRNENPYRSETEQRCEADDE